MFSCFAYTLAVRLNIKWQLALILTKVTLDMTNGIASLVVLYWVKNFELCNTNLSLLTRRLSFVIKKVMLSDFASQLESIWQHQSVDQCKRLVIENPEWFVELVLHSLLGTI